MFVRIVKRVEKKRAKETESAYTCGRQDADVINGECYSPTIQYAAYAMLLMLMLFSASNPTSIRSQTLQGQVSMHATKLHTMHTMHTIHTMHTMHADAADAR